ncbi:MAG: hypothetical protein JWQ80_434 [Massilia sp.]|nr:hypothetical protein [Massilia sp.]
MKFIISLLLFSVFSCSFAAPAAIETPATSELIARRGQVFTFKPAGNASRYIVYVGSEEGARDLESISLDSETSFTLAEIPASLEQVHIRLWSLIDNAWSSNSYVFNIRKRDYYPQMDGAINKNAAQIWGAAWSHPVVYSGDDSGIACNDPRASTVSTCTITMGLDHRTDEQYKRVIGDIAKGASAALVNVKLKSWALAENAYCQISLTAGADASQLPDSDFLAHTEVFGDQNFKLSGRRISYAAIPFTLNRDGQFTIKVSKEVIGECEVSIALNVLGVYK